MTLILFVVTIGIASLSEASAANGEVHVIVYLTDGRVIRVDPQTGQHVLLFSDAHTGHAQASRVQVSAVGTVAYVAREGDHADHLYVWHNGVMSSFSSRDFTFGHVIWDEQGWRLQRDTLASYPPFVLSPDGRYVVRYFNDTIDLLPGSSSNYPETQIVQFSLGILDTSTNSFKTIRIDTLRTDGYDADQQIVRRVTGWSRANPEWLYVQEVQEDHQMGHDAMSGLWAVNVVSGLTRPIPGKVDIILDVAPNDSLIAHTPVDDTCCAGINYSSNDLILYSLTSDANITLFSEYERYHNIDQAEEHAPINAAFSPDVHWIAATIDELIVYGAASNNPGEFDDPDSTSYTGRYLWLNNLRDGVEISFKNREFIGWIDSQHVLVRSYEAHFEKVDGGPSKRIENRGEPMLLEIHTGTEAPLFAGGTPGEIKMLHLVWVDRY